MCEKCIEKEMNEVFRTEIGISENGPSVKAEYKIGELLDLAETIVAHAIQKKEDIAIKTAATFAFFASRMESAQKQATFQEARHDACQEELERISKIGDLNEMKKELEQLIQRDKEIDVIHSILMGD